MNRRFPVVLIVAIGLLTAPTIAAAAEPALATSLIAGHEIDVTGTGFPADSDVVLVIQRNGADDGSQMLHADATGTFTAVIPAGPGRGGRYSLTATSGSAKAVAETVAVETAGGLNAGGAQPTPPTTDTAAASTAGSTFTIGWAAVTIAALVVLLVSFGYLGKPSRRRS